VRSTAATSGQGRALQENICFHSPIWTRARPVGIDSFAQMRILADRHLKKSRSRGIRMKNDKSSLDFRSV